MLKSIILRKLFKEFRMKIIVKFSIWILFLFTYLNADVLKSIDKDIWLKLIEEKQYEKLDSKLQILQDKYIDDITKERTLLLALKSFENSSPKLEYMLEDWVKNKPNSIFAHTALGIYHTNLAFLSRGTDFITKTNQKQIAKMYAHRRFILFLF